MHARAPEHRDHARRLMVDALDRYMIVGLRHNLNFLRRRDLLLK